ncbi:hypothetical protein D9M72_504520 [compost metagenome]
MNIVVLAGSGTARKDDSARVDRERVVLSACKRHALCLVALDRTQRPLESRVCRVIVWKRDLGLDRIPPEVGKAPAVVVEAGFTGKPHDDGVELAQLVVNFLVRPGTVGRVLRVRIARPLAPIATVKPDGGRAVLGFHREVQQEHAGHDQEQRPSDRAEQGRTGERAIDANGPPHDHRGT